jgi:hypothetical protein
MCTHADVRGAFSVSCAASHAAGTIGHDTRYHTRAPPATAAYRHSRVRQALAATEGYRAGYSLYARAYTVYHMPRPTKRQR